MSSYNIILIGCGNMGSALLESWHDSNLIHKAQICDPNEQLSGIVDGIKVFHVKHFTELDFSDIDVCILAVKPQIMDAVCGELSQYCNGSFAVLSIAAGKPISFFEKSLKPDVPIIRAMPNTPAMVQKGVTALIGNSQTNENHKNCASDLFDACGKTHWIDDETQMDAVTAVSGSGPAYVFHFIEALTKAAIENGLDPDMAANMARQTIIGAAALADSQNNVSCETLRENVTSKGGTTAAGLEILMDGRFQEILTETITNAKKRSEELGN